MRIKSQALSHFEQVTNPVSGFLPQEFVFPFLNKSTHKSTRENATIQNQILLHTKTSASDFQKDN